VFEALKEKVYNTPKMGLPNLRLPFEIEIDASGYAMEAVVWQQHGPVTYHLETFTRVAVSYPTYGKRCML
jgi:hypothetical protein